jgi:hypothetical protein
MVILQIHGAAFFKPGSSYATSPSGAWPDEETLEQVAQPPFPDEQQKEQEQSIGHGLVFSQADLR